MLETPVLRVWELRQARRVGRTGVMLETPVLRVWELRQARRVGRTEVMLETPVLRVWELRQARRVGRTVGHMLRPLPPTCYACKTRLLPPLVELRLKPWI